MLKNSNGFGLKLSLAVNQDAIKFLKTLDIQKYTKQYTRENIIVFLKTLDIEKYNECGDVYLCDAFSEFQKNWQIGIFRKELRLLAESFLKTTNYVFTIRNPLVLFPFQNGKQIRIDFLKYIQTL